MIDTHHKVLSIVLIITGLVFIALNPIMNLIFPGSFGWEPRQAEYEEMIQGFYFVLGVFAIIAARRIDQHLSLIWFVAVSNLVHGGIMLVQALEDAHEHANLFGDVPALIITGVIIAVFAPKRLSNAPAGQSA